MSDSGDDAEEQEERPQLPNAADRGSQRRQRQRARRREEEDAEFWSAVFASPVGRRQMWEILAAARTHRLNDCFAVGPNGFPQPEATWFNAGQCAFGERLFRSWLKFAPEGVLLMMREHDPQLATARKRKG